MSVVSAKKYNLWILYLETTAVWLRMMELLALEAAFPFKVKDPTVILLPWIKVFKSVVTNSIENQ